MKSSRVFGSVDMSRLEQGISLFDDVGRFKGSARTERMLTQMLSSREFLHAVYCPEDPRRIYSKEDFAAKLVQLYEVASKPRTVAAVADILYDYGVRNFPRTTAVFLATVVNIAIADMNARATDIGSRHDHGEIGDEEYDRLLSKLDRYQKSIQEVLQCAKDIVKKDARELARTSGVPKALCASALYTVPEPWYVDTYKIGFYVNSLMGNVYGYLNVSEDIDYDFFESLSWTKFFGGIFGKARLPEVASLLMLETDNRLETYRVNPATVRECVESIERWAVYELNGAPENVRDHMFELYLKRLNLLLDKSGIRVHLDLRGLDNLRFSSIANTVEKYRTKLDGILAKSRTLDNATADTRPG